MATIIRYLSVSTDGETCRLTVRPPEKSQKMTFTFRIRLVIPDAWARTTYRDISINLPEPPEPEYTVEAVDEQAGLIDADSEPRYDPCGMATALKDLEDGVDKQARLLEAFKEAVRAVGLLDADVEPNTPYEYDLWVEAALKKLEENPDTAKIAQKIRALLETEPGSVSYSHISEVHNDVERPQ